MRNLLTILLIFSFILAEAQTTITCHNNEIHRKIQCDGCFIKGEVFTGVVVKELKKKDIAICYPFKINFKGNNITLDDGETKVTFNIKKSQFSTFQEFRDFLDNCFNGDFNDLEDLIENHIDNDNDLDSLNEVQTLIVIDSFLEILLNGNTVGPPIDLCNAITDCGFFDDFVVGIGQVDDSLEIVFNSGLIGYLDNAFKDWYLVEHNNQSGFYDQYNITIPNTIPFPYNDGLQSAPQGGYYVEFDSLYGHLNDGSNVWLGKSHTLMRYVNRFSGYVFNDVPRGILDSINYRALWAYDLNLNTESIALPISMPFSVKDGDWEPDNELSYFEDGSVADTICSGLRIWNSGDTSYSAFTNANCTIDTTWQFSRQATFMDSLYWTQNYNSNGDTWTNNDTLCFTKQIPFTDSSYLYIRSNCIVDTVVVQCN